MNEFSRINGEFERVLKIHKNKDCCHSIDKKQYRLLCKYFFSNTQNKAIEIMFAEECLTYGTESENEFLDWLNKE